MAGVAFLGRVAFLVGHDDDVVLDPSVPRPSGRGAAKRSSKWEGMQSDMAIVDAVAASYPSLSVTTIRTVEEMLATDADVLVIISYKTQPSFAWYASFFDALRTLEARGVVVYPTCDFKETISSKVAYTRLLQAAELPMCPTAVLERAECVSSDGTLDPALVETRLTSALTSLGLLLPTSGGGAAQAVPPPMPPRFHLVTKPSNADGGFGVAFWESSSSSSAAAAAAAASPPTMEAAAAENANLQCCASSSTTTTDSSSSTKAAAPLVRSLQLRTMLSAGVDVAKATPSDEACPGGKEAAAAAAATTSAEFLSYLNSVGFVGRRPHLLLQPLVPLLAQHYEIKIYFLEKKPFFASLVYGKEKLMARVVRPSTDAALFEYLSPLLDESIRALDALPPDGPHDPKILMRVDWGTGEPLLPEQRAAAATAAATAGKDKDEVVVDEEKSAHEGAAAEEEDAGFLKRALVKRAGSLAAPQKKLKRSMDENRHAPLTGSRRHFINEVEIHPGYYVDWDETPDETIAPLAEAYGRYLTRILSEKRAAAST